MQYCETESMVYEESSEDSEDLEFNSNNYTIGRSIMRTRQNNHTMHNRSQHAIQQQDEPLISRQNSKSLFDKRGLNTTGTGGSSRNWKRLVKDFVYSANNFDFDSLQSMDKRPTIH